MKEERKRYFYSDLFNFAESSHISLKMPTKTVDSIAAQRMILSILEEGENTGLVVKLMGRLWTDLWIYDKDISSIESLEKSLIYLKIREEDIDYIKKKWKAKK